MCIKCEIKSEVLLKDCLENLSMEVTRGLPEHQVYGRGILSGIVSAAMATGLDFRQAIEFVVEFLPADPDHGCYPSSWQNTIVEFRSAARLHPGKRKKVKH